MDFDYDVRFNVPGLPEGVDFFRTGSSVIGGATSTSDTDIVVVYDRELDQVLRQAGWEGTDDRMLDQGRYPNTSVEECYRFNEYNIIAVKDQEAYDKWYKFTQLACMLYLKEKSQRVMLAQFITEGNIRGTHIYY